MTEKTRRTPRQPRSEATVEAILEAAFQLLEQGGVRALTTNHIAERAGVSVGTLYQYFKGKQAILAALAQRQAAAARDRIAAIVIDGPRISAVRMIVRTLATAFEGAPATRRALLDAFAGEAGDAAVMRHHRLFFDAIAGKARFDFDMTPEAGFVLTHAVIGLLRAATIETELALDPQRLEDELVRLMEGYILALIEAKSAPGPHGIAERAGR
ncbi:TetR/AcrR family transcriptional regulator [Caulobacter vibrioides]|uniref:TetR-family transcriptional regulator n=1 Tax=Caulobacter vibrioides (strain NA1000 / CB15N) TaxID=565050 RepID=A0A0H3C519_CAUVN|nr:TetR/AcrR family transcriptional regulator [Caulobacter vibrioides]YP_002516332.1 TetR-family transcriptional regulator [Caulobacter vibrioides NA1000]ACL94424.1 TetR-family transcriptional regulator [Caulobacter vibrioides NA1000]ATC27750.1 TetR/AcrR family transcriptional regulator [Caulobacter vibrioides]QXZ52990.1 TetR/AcrR family transcriptional regulator [Caulobacter vibrioides]